MKCLLRPLLCVFFATATSVAAIPESLRWGPMDQGLQMAVSVNPENGYATGWIRNGTKATIDANNGYICYYMSLFLEVRERGEWKRLPRKEDGYVRISMGIGPRESNRVTLKPGAILTGSGAPFIGTVPGRRLCALPPPSAAPPATKEGSFLLDLGDFEWPRTVLEQKTIEFRLVQELSGPGLDGDVTLVSAGVGMPGEKFRHVVEELSAAAEYWSEFQEMKGVRFGPGSPPPGGIAILQKQFPSGASVRLEMAVATTDEPGPLGVTPRTYCAYTLVAARLGGPDVVVWQKRGPVREKWQWPDLNIIPFEMVEHEGWICFLYRHFRELKVEAFRITAADEAVRGRTHFLGIFPRMPADHAVGFRQDDDKLKVVFFAGPPESRARSGSYWQFTVKGDAAPKWWQLPSMKNVPPRFD